MEKHHKCHIRLVTRMWRNFARKQLVLSELDTEPAKFSSDDSKDFDTNKDKGKGNSKDMDVTTTDDSNDDDDD